MENKYVQFLLHAMSKANGRSNSRKLRRQSRTLERRIQPELNKQAEFIVKRSRQLFGKAQNADDFIDGIFDDIQDGTMINVVIDGSSASMSFGAKYRIQKMKLAHYGISFDLEHPLAVEYLKTDRPLELAKLKDTVKQHIKPILQRGVAEGASINEMAKEIRENYAFSKTRALMIANNEVARAYEYGNMIPMQDLAAQVKIVIKAWSTVGDAKVEQVCIDNEARGWIKMDESFPSGDNEAPTDDHPNCRCTTLWDFED
ncbi:hypothetical protein A2125_00900 [Candidatus Woesebacteria bacterium GWB1_43_5]|uniref:Phage head morphogenesis domain-containing protein n=1 Tax=Candidatus Woesebacteria bacterium GWB1_43_5 TaxID=1802474 RepID=A0A1F7WTY9_9BACT|nr:MAG: hypothetical protein A2125_00900 [Candidatus Woesebacteria bacterium GWB1_43_5]